MWDSMQRKASGDFKSAAQSLAQAGLQGSDQYAEYVFASEHQSEAWLHAEDVPSRLLELIDKDLAAIVDSGLLAKEFELMYARGRKGPPRVKAK